ncbi:MAG: export transporter permease LptG, partial [Pseudomonadota bacterium]
ELSRYQNYMSENAQQSLAVEQAFWGRLVNPLLTLAMLALALPMIMRFDRNVSTGRRAVTGISLGIGFYLMDRMLSHLGIIYELPPVMTALAPTALVLTAAAVLNHRYRY